jgi:uncharacterized iron-regulated membrane protein
MAKIKVVHKYVSLTLAALWILQALTGALLVFHWELDDLTLNLPEKALDVEKFGNSIDAMIASRQYGIPTGVYWSAGQEGRYDVVVQQTEKSDVLRVDGDGVVLRRRPWNHDFLHIGPFQIITYLHQTLFAHDVGKWILGVSGLFLFTNIVLGLKLAWPRRRTWSAALRPRASHSLAAAAYAWHRAVGLWLGMVALLAIGTGVLMAFETPLAAWFDDARPEPSAEIAAAEVKWPTPIGTAAAITTARARYPSAALTGIDLPSDDNLWFRVELREPGEIHRTSGRTSVYVSSRSGRVIREYAGEKAPLKTRIWDSFYSIHTGEAGGWPGRIAATLIGVWLLSMIVLGLTLWWSRRRPVTRRSGTNPS